MLEDKKIKIFLLILATYRLASMLSGEEGPYLSWPKSDSQEGIFEAIRTRAGAYRYGPDGKPETSLGRGVTCPLCTGVYISFFLLTLIFFPTRLGDMFLVWMGVSGGQVFLENLTSDEAIQSAIEEVADNMEE
jgi:hypothetical protein